MFNSFNEQWKIIFKKVNEKSLNTRRFWKQFKFGEFCLETNLLKNNEFLAKISKISIAAALKWKIYVIKTKLKTILDGSWTKKVNISIGARPRADTFSLRRPARSSFYQNLLRFFIKNNDFFQNVWRFSSIFIKNAFCSWRKHRLLYKVSPTNNHFKSWFRHNHP